MSRDELRSIFLIADVVPLGYVSTALHSLFALLQLAAFTSASRTVVGAGTAH